MTIDPFTLAGKSILITGASSGIGRATAVACSKRGATLIVSGRDQARLDETLRSLEGSEHRAISADLTDPDQRLKLADATGPIDGLFFSAGVASSAPFRLVSEKHIRALMAIDFEAPVLLTQRLLLKKQIRPGGSIVYNTAGSARNSPMGASMYSAAKAGLYAAARSLALEVARDRIRVTCLQLGYVKTALLDKVGGTGVDLDARDELTPLGLGDPADAANAAVFLLSDASRWISRTAITVDGGVSIRISA
jgi:NAD(P)-dependent dehydrogenase (short-subunit alcohol dehydrogenase family)